MSSLWCETSANDQYLLHESSMVLYVKTEKYTQFMIEL